MAKKKHTHQNNNSNDPQNHSPKMAEEEQTHQNDETAPPATMEENQAEKLSNLKSLNSVLLKETVEKRQEISSLLESKKSLEAELTRSESEVESLRGELNRVGESLRKVEEVNEGLRRDKEMVEREMSEVVKERDEMERKKFEGDLEIGSLKKLEMELRGEIKKGKEGLREAIREKEDLEKGVAVRDEEVRKLKEKVDEMEVKERNVGQEMEELKGKFESVAKALEKSENKVESMRVENEKLRNKIEGLDGEKEVIVRENAELRKAKGEQEGRINELDEEVCGLNAIVLSLREDEQKWRVKFFELEKSNAEVVEELEGLKSELGAVLEEKKEKEREIEGLMGEKSSALGKVGELEVELESVRRVKEEVFKEKSGLEEVKLRQENEITVLRCEVNELRGNVLSLQELNKDQVEKNKKLASEIDDCKNALDRVAIERDGAKRTLEEEKVNGVQLQAKVSEISKKMEETAKVIEELRGAGDTLVGEKKEIENKYSKLVEEKGFVEKKFVETNAKVAELEGSLRSKSDMFELALAMLRNTVLHLSVENGKKGENDSITVNDRDVDGDLEPYLAELEAIRSVFRTREEKVGEMQQEMESLQLSVLEAKKKKSFWTLVSSATTILAAVVSFAYAARVR